MSLLVGPNDAITIPAGVNLDDPHLFIADTHTYRSPNYQTSAQLPIARNEQTVCVHVWHKTEGHIAGDMSRLLSVAAQVSCHAYAPRTLSESNRVYYQVVDDTNEAWQCGVQYKADQKDGAFRKYLGWDNENYRSIGDELEGTEGEQFTQWQLIWCLWRQRQLSKRYPNMLLDRVHIIGHYEITRQKQDPQLFPWKGFMDALSTQQPAVQPLWIGGAKYPIANQTFIDFYKAEPKSLQYFGLPISETHLQVLGDGQTYTIQYFERARFELHNDKVLLGLVGAELLAKG